MNKLQHKIFLASLLHDIGKFWQRADIKDNALESDVISPYIKNLARGEELGRLAPNGFPIYGHVLYTASFLEKYKNLWANFFGQENSEDNFVNLSIYHHYPKTVLQKIIQIADHWSSGAERVERDESNIELPSDYRNRRLENIFNFVFKSDTNVSSSKGEYHLSPLNISSSLFVRSKGKYNYSELWRRFSDDFKKLLDLNVNDLKHFSESMVYLLKKYTWCIPATTRKDHFHDVSLFEHSKTVAAIATCLYIWAKENNLLSVSENSGGNNDGGGGESISSIRHGPFKPSDLEEQLRTSYPILLTCVDVVGIQNYIYNIIDTKAARSLKGRSFYIQLLSETVVYELLDGLELTSGQIIYNSGGKAYLFLPNTKQVKDFVEKYRKELEKWLLCTHELDVYVAIDYIPFRYDEKKNLFFYLSDNSSDEMSGSNVGELWNRLAEKMSKWKYKRYFSLEDSDFSAIFEPFGRGGDVECSDLSGKELGVNFDFCKKTNTNEGLELNKKELLDDLVISGHENQQLDVGRALANARCLLQSNDRVSIENAYRSRNNTLAILRIHNTFWGVSSETPVSFDRGRIFHLIKDGEVELSQVRGNSTKGYRFYGGINIPTNDEGIKTFEKLVIGEPKKIGILRMDVDNLGNIFKDGFGQNNNFARLSQLSFALDWFFSGYLNHLQMSNSDYRKNIIIVYSGGDDLFAVGDWESIINFSTAIRKHFAGFVQNHPSLSISGGIVITHPKFPIRKGALLSGKEEDEAKKLIRGGRAKDAIALFGEVVGWEEIINFDNSGNNSDPNQESRLSVTISRLKDELLELLEEDIINSAFIHRLQYYYQQDKKYRNNQGDLAYRWECAYWLSRYVRMREGRIGERSNFFDEVSRDLRIFFDHAARSTLLEERAYIIYGIASRWVELLERRKHPSLNTTEQ